LANGAPTFYQPGKNLFTLLFQTTGNQLSGLVTVNFFFNGDTVNPGISAVVPVWPGLGFTYFRRNTATTLVSLYMRDVDNHADLSYGDGQDNVSLTAVMVANRRQLGFVNRVSIGALRPDTLNDAVVIFELTAAPAVPPTSPAGPNTGGYLAPTVSEPLNAYVGEAEPGTLPEERGGTPGIMEPTESVLAPTLALPSGESTPAEAQLGTESTPAEATASAAAESDTPTPPSSVSGALRYRTPTPRSTSGASAAPSTPTGAAASEAATTATPARTPAAHKTPTPHRHTHHRTD